MRYARSAITGLVGLLLAALVLFILVLSSRRTTERALTESQARLAAIHWNNGINERQNKEIIKSAHDFSHAARYFALAGDSSGSRKAQLASEFLLGDYRLRGWMESEGNIAGAKFSQADRWIVTWSYKRIDNLDATAEVRVWDGRTGESITPPLHHDFEIIGAEISPDGTRLIAWSHNGSVCVWSIERAKLMFPPLKHGGDRFRVLGATINADQTKILTWGESFGRDEGFAQVWDARSGRSITQLLSVKRSLTGGAFTADQRRILTWGWDGAVRFWDAATGELLLGPLKLGRAVRGAGFSNDRSRFLAWGVTEDGAGVARVWDVQTGNAVTPFIQQEETITGAVFSADARQILTWSDDEISEKGAARVWDAQTGQPATPLLRHDGDVLGGAFGPGKGRVLNGASLAVSMDLSRIVTGSGGDALLWKRRPEEAFVVGIQTPRA